MSNRFCSVPLCVAILALLTSHPAQAASEQSEILLRSGEKIYGRILQEDAAWLVVDVSGGGIVTIERARVASWRAAAPVSGPSAAAVGEKASAHDNPADSWRLQSLIGWGWLTSELDGDITVRDGNTTAKGYLTADDVGWDDLPSLYLRLTYRNRSAYQSTPVIVGAQVGFSAGDIMSPEAPAWSLEGLLGIQFGGAKVGFDLLVGAGYAWSSGDMRMTVFGSNGPESLTVTETASGWIARLEGVLSIAIGEASWFDIGAGLLHRRLMLDDDYQTANYSGEIDLRSKSDGAYISLGLSFDL